MKDLKMAKIMLCIMGIVLLVLGALTLALPMLTLTTLALILGGGFVISGIFCLVSFFSEKDILKNPGWVLVHGILDIVIGIFLLWNLGPMIVSIPYIVAFWMMFGGIAKFSASFTLRKMGEDKWWALLANGMLGILISFLMMFFPFFGIGFLVVMIGTYLVINGVLIFFEAAAAKTLNAVDGDIAVVK
jgi:uncharacterized membrane protein HdeD (DUF308 family)